MIDTILQFIRDAGAKSEEDTERDGFLSFHAESHSMGVGIGAGFFFTATGNLELLGIVLTAIVAGLRGRHEGERTKILGDIIHEPHYALIGLVVGALLGTLV